jgi:hypothetical protein
MKRALWLLVLAGFVVAGCHKTDKTGKKHVKTEKHEKKHHQHEHHAEVKA